MIVEGRCPGLQEVNFYAIQLVELAMFLLNKMTMFRYMQ